MNKAIQISEITNLASEVGLNLLGITDLSPLNHDEKSLKTWQAAGYAGEMAYMLRDSALLSNPSRLINARTAIAFAVRYSSEPHPPLPPGFGRVARYAWGADYHAVLRSRLGLLTKRLSAYLGRDISARYFSDAVPLLERALATRAGLGFIGKNTMLIKPGLGSFFFIAELLCDLEVEPLATPLTGTCGTCSRCQDACPTAAFTADFQLDARRCISYLTIEKRGLLETKQRRDIGEWVFGCDLCQDTCPFNYVALKKRAPPDLPELGSSHGVGPLLNLEHTLGIRTDSEFKARFSRSALTRSGRIGLIRNSIIVAANTSALALTPAIVKTFEDASPIIRASALWAIFKLHGAESLVFKNCCERARKDEDLLVRNECADLEP